MIEQSSPCLCGSQKTYIECCGVFHDNLALPQTAEQLMRSRFTAYAMRNVEYLLSSWDKTKRPDTIDFSKDNSTWTRLEIVSTKKGTEKDSKGIVEFKAYYLLEDEEYVMHEISRFKKMEGVWFYLDGVVKAVKKVNQAISQGKNAPCSCGSGKKFKRCCGA